MYHTPLPADRGDYYVITLLEADGVTPYTNPVQLRGEIENNVAQSLITDITPNADGTIRIYLSSGSYYFSSPDNNLKTRNFSVTSNISHNPALSLAMTDGGLASFSGLIWIDANKNGIDDFNENVQAGAVVSLFNVSTNTITNSAITDSNGIFLISNVDAGEYYIVAGNIPLDYVFEDISSSSVTATGISRIAYTVSGTDEVNGINIPIIFNVGARGPQGAPGEFFSSNNINMFNPDLMTAYKNMQVNLGRVASGNGNEIYYSPADNSIILGAEGIYMVNFKANAHFINAMDYMALQVEFAGYMIEQGLAYTNNEGTLTTNLCIDTRKYYGNKLQIINVSNDDFMIDNLTMTIFRMA